MLGLSHLLFPMTLDEFFDTYFEKRYLHISSDNAQQSAEVLDISRLERVLWQQSARLNEFVIVRQNGVRQIAPQTAAFKWLQDRFNEGASIILNSIHDCDVEFAEFQQRVATELGMEVGSNVYLTPASQQTFPVHFDTHDTLLIQLHGAKRWRLHASAADLPMQHHFHTVELEELGPIVAEFDLQPGHLLYIPRGVPHWGTAAGMPSLHVTLGLRPVLYVDLLHSLVRLAADANPELRAAVPRRQLASVEPDGVDAATKLLASIIESPAVRRATLARCIEHAVARSASLPDAGLIGMYAGVTALDLDDWVERCGGLQTHVSGLETQARIAFGGYRPFDGSPEAASLSGPLFLQPTFEFLAQSRTPFRVRDLRGALTDKARLVVAKRLLSGGLLRRVPG
jgi:hypothetical protein